MRDLGTAKVRVSLSIDEYRHNPLHHSIDTGWSQVARGGEGGGRAQLGDAGKRPTGAGANQARGSADPERRGRRRRKRDRGGVLHLYCNSPNVRPAARRLPPPVFSACGRASAQQTVDSGRRKRRAKRNYCATRRPGRPRAAPRTKALGFFRLTPAQALRMTRTRADASAQLGDVGKRPTGAGNNQASGSSDPERRGRRRRREATNGSGYYPVER